MQWTKRKRLLDSLSTWMAARNVSLTRLMMACYYHPKSRHFFSMISGALSITIFLFSTCVCPLEFPPITSQPQTFNSLEDVPEHGSNQCLTIDILDRPNSFIHKKSWYAVLIAPEDLTPSTQLPSLQPAAQLPPSPLVSEECPHMLQHIRRANRSLWSDSAWRQPRTRMKLLIHV